jgi:hypothetical protein
MDAKQQKIGMCGVKMADIEKQKKIEVILNAMAAYLTPLFNEKKTGSYEITIELNVNNGGIRDIYFRSQAREKE